MTKNKANVKIISNAVVIKEATKMITEMKIIMTNWIMIPLEVAKALARVRDTRRNDSSTTDKKVEMKVKEAKEVKADNIDLERNIIKKNRKRIIKTKSKIEEVDLLLSKSSKRFG